MRELKFRVWDKLEKEWCSFHPQICSGGVKGAFEFSGSQYQRKNLVILQYTGLKDKHGKDIYEGDIVSGICLNDGPQICVVGFDTFGIFYTKIKFYPCEEWDNVAMLAQEHNEIVGNIFENSELLK